MVVPDLRRRAEFEDLEGGCVIFSGMVLLTGDRESLCWDTEDDRRDGIERWSPSFLRGCQATDVEGEGRGGGWAFQVQFEH